MRMIVSRFFLTVGPINRNGSCFAHIHATEIRQGCVGSAPITRTRYHWAPARNYLPDVLNDDRQDVEFPTLSKRLESRSIMLHLNQRVSRPHRTRYEGL